LTERSRFSFESWGRALERAFKLNNGAAPAVSQKCSDERVARTKAAAEKENAAVAEANTKAVPPSEKTPPIKVGSTIPTKPQPNGGAKPTGPTTEVANAAKPAKSQPPFGEKMIDFVKAKIINKIQDRYDESFPFFSGNVEIYFRVDKDGKPISSDVDSSNPAAFMVWNELRQLQFPPSPYGESAYHITFGFNADKHVASFVGGVAYPAVKE
jgi:hypothetical protein